MVVREVHEAGKIVIPKFAKVTNLKQWRMGVCRGLANASGRSDAAEIPWLLEATGGAKKYDDLEDSGDPRFRTLDQRLAFALVATIKAECQILATKLQTLDEKALLQGKLLKGRQLVWLIFDNFRLNTDMSMVYDIEDITQLQYSGDAKIHSFYRLWFMMTEECEVKLPERKLRNILLKKLEKSNKLEEYVA